MDTKRLSLAIEFMKQIDKYDFDTERFRDYLKILLDLAIKVKEGRLVDRDSLDRVMVEHRHIDIELPSGKWACLVYKDDTPEKCEWINLERFNKVYEVAKGKLSTPRLKGDEE